MATKVKATKKASPETKEVKVKATKKVKAVKTPAVTPEKKAKAVKEDAPKVSKKTKVIPENVSGKKKAKVTSEETKTKKKAKVTSEKESKYKYPEGMDSIERKTFRSKARAAIRKFEKQLEEATSPKDKKAIKAEYDAFKAETFA